ncbi:MAG TPA: S8 family serine peptidase [Gaiellaceae bacterium]|nr:S8 family serine peptidase [Gaiellaceae bacterium]
MKRALLLLSTALAVLVAGGAAHAGAPPSHARVEVVVLLRGAPLGGRALASAAGTRVVREQSDFARRLTAAIPEARVRWRYRKVLDGLAIVLPADRLDRLGRLPGVEEVYPSVRYHARAVTGPGVIGAPQVWGPGLETAGQGIKIGIIDDGVDQTHPFLSPKGFTMPAGFPKGQTAYTTAKVIVARAFAPASAGSKNAELPFDPQNSFHATHVAGIAAGDAGTTASVDGRAVPGLSGVAPRGYIGNYKALTVPTPGFGLDGNSPEIAAAIEAAVQDGMNVINLSLGEPEVTPARDLVVRALEGAARAGVVPVVAAGNDFADYGRGSLGSPGGAPSAITVAASSDNGVLASFSSSGPTPVSLEMKPDVTAPGVSILSSVPRAQGPGLWAEYSGTSMATPHVSGAAAVLMQRHPTWTVAQVKSALVQTAIPAYSDDARRVEAPTTREGGGLVNLPRADAPLLFAAPTGLSFGLVEPGAAPVTRTVTLTDAGGGGQWAVSLQSPDADVATPATAQVPGTLTVTVRAPTGQADADHSGFVVLGRSGETRRIPYWFRVATPRLGAPTTTLHRAGVYSGNTARGSARVTGYRYPDDPGGAGLSTSLAGPEQVFRVKVPTGAANFGVAVLSGAPVEPRVVFAGNENRLTGYAGLPVNLNPYLDWFGRREPIAGAILPAAGLYDVVFDETTRSRAGAFRFRLWIDDRTPPKLRLETRTVIGGGSVLVSATDAGAGVDARAIVATVDGSTVNARLVGTRIAIPTKGLRAGRHTLVLRVSDRQEAKNMEDVARILPNTRTLRASFTTR